ncbi:hypothetical protein CEXT_380041 [Caerostris extrusa]|uniref:Uncharacterized protein n=1 Tax=Caerostris extrusa TaxID=172846 RepID=A0AAV4TB50_CAEEX|nr:hypothetical protein CEXT_380041 [Caerostris extrusa]
MARLFLSPVTKQQATDIWISYTLLWHSRFTLMDIEMCIKRDTVLTRVSVQFLQLQANQKMVNVNLLIVISMLAFVAIIDCRYPYQDSYRQGDIVPYGNDRYRGNNGGYSRERYPINGNRDDQYQRDRQDRRSYPRRIPSDQYQIQIEDKGGNIVPDLEAIKSITIMITIMAKIEDLSILKKICLDFTAMTIPMTTVINDPRFHFPHLIIIFICKMHKIRDCNE